MTRDELLLLQKLAQEWHRKDKILSYAECIEAERIINRELKLKDIAEEIPFMHKGNNETIQS